MMVKSKGASGVKDLIRSRQCDFLRQAGVERRTRADDRGGLGPRLPQEVQCVAVGVAHISLDRLDCLCREQPFWALPERRVSCSESVVLKRSVST